MSSLPNETHATPQNADADARSDPAHELYHSPDIQNLTFRKVILGKAKVCTSFVDVPREVDLGQCTIGSATKGQLSVR